MKILAMFILATCCNLTGWGAVILAETTGEPFGITQIIQGGGSVGLIAALLFALKAIWEDRKSLKKELREERERSRKDIESVRDDYRDYIERLQQQHQKDLSKLTDTYTEELKSQINLLREETAGKLKESIRKERETSDNTYLDKGEG